MVALCNGQDGSQQNEHRANEVQSQTEPLISRLQGPVCPAPSTSHLSLLSLPHRANHHQSINQSICTSCFRTHQGSQTITGKTIYTRSQQVCFGGEADMCCCDSIHTEQCSYILKLATTWHAKHMGKQRAAGAHSYTLTHGQGLGQAQEQTAMRITCGCSQSDYHSCWQTSPGMQMLGWSRHLSDSH